MRKCCLFSLLLLFNSITVHPATRSDIALRELNDAVKNKQRYVSEKEDKIESIKKDLTEDISLLQEYHMNENLCREYQKFKLDSAILYAKRNIEIANVLNDKALFYPARIQLALLYSSSGKYRECEIILKSIDKKVLPDKTLSLYYEAYCLFFGHYASNVQTHEYDERIELYRDSLLSVLKPATNKFIITQAEKDIYRGHLAAAEKDLLLLLQKTSKDSPDYAMLTYLLGFIYQTENNIDSAVEYYALSATADIKNSLKDNASMQILASIFYDKGDINGAYRYVQSALEDAVFCNVQFRTIRMSEFYTIINTAYLEKETESRKKLQNYLILISILSLFLIIAVIYVYRQMKKVSNIREELHRTNLKLLDLNKEISETNEKLNDKNAQLSEANIIKEEYIAHFFDLCSAYINKLEDYRKSLNKKALDNKTEELFKMLKSTVLVENELEELYRNFDTIFINLYPAFVNDFNALLIEEERIQLKPGEILNTEFRIFALIRLGITDSVKIAAFLRYSLSTIYNYRTKARNKAAVSRDEFEKMVMKIGSVHL